MMFLVNFAPPDWVEGVGRWGAVSVAIAIPAWFIIKTAVSSVVRPLIERSDEKLEQHMLDEIATRDLEREELVSTRKELVEAVAATHTEVTETRQEVMAAVAAVDNRVAVVEGHVGLYTRK